MTTIQCVAYTSFIFCFLALVAFDNHTITSFVYAIETFAMSGCLTYSMNKLGKFSTILDGQGITTSKLLLMVHLISFWIVSFLQAANLVVTVLIHNNDTVTETNPSQNKLIKTEVWLDMLTTFTFFLIMLTMFIMFVRYGTSLSPQEKSKLTLQFL